MLYTIKFIFSISYPEKLWCLPRISISNATNNNSTGHAFQDIELQIIPNRAKIRKNKIQNFDQAITFHFLVCAIYANMSRMSMFSLLTVIESDAIGHHRFQMVRLWSNLCIA